MSDVAEEIEVNAVEAAKLASGYLKGEIPTELANGDPFWSKDAIALLKHHGTYEQDDRDHRADAKKAGAPGGKYFSMMIRTALPGGRLSSDQLLTELDLCDQLGNGTLRITTRQGLQLHGVLKSNLKETIARINQAKMTTLAACGDVNRNVMCSPVPLKHDGVYDEIHALADQIAVHLRPKTPAYYELWLTNTETGEKTLAGGGATADPFTVEPIYGAAYLPRKFKIAISLPGDNSADVYAQDVGLVAVCENHKVVGYNVIVGGGFGVTPSAAKTFVAVGQEMCYASADDVIDVVTAIVKVQRDFGNRADRKTARLKYLIHDWGLDRFRQKVAEYFGGELEPLREAPVTGFDDGMGWHEQGDGRWYYGLNVENGRIKDEGDFRLKAALREICTQMAPALRLTPHQGILFCDLTTEVRPKLEGILRAHGVPLTEDFTNVRRWSMSCPALPYCGLAVTESERYLPTIITELEAELSSLGLEDEIFTTRMTGCPNGCARPYNAEVGLIGKTKGKYTVLLGGSRLGHRLNWIYKDLVPQDQVAATLAPVLRHFKTARQNGESFGDFCCRVGKDELLANCSA
jgi:sulfite reductase (ferredoxin)